MPLWPPAPEPLALLDGCACAALSAAAAVKARMGGAQFMGALALGAFCGIAAPLCRELALGGSPRAAFAWIPDCVLAGALGGVLAVLLAPRLAESVFFWLDAAGFSLAGCLAACAAAPTSGAAAAFLLALICGLAPGLMRDVALGDAALLLEESWYAGALGAGAALAMLLLFFLPRSLAPGARLPLAAILGGAALACALRGWKGRR